MKKGFTLIELLAAVVVLSIIAILLIPVVGKLIKGTTDNAYELNIKAIENAAYDWALKNPLLLPSVDGNRIVVYLDELKRETTLDVNISNPRTHRLFSNNTSVTITKSGKKYTYTVYPIEIGIVSEEGAPTLTGDFTLARVEVNQEGTPYNITMPVASIPGSKVTYQILKDNKEVSKVDTTKIGKYTIVYSATKDNKTSMYEQMVFVRDTTAPTITFEDDLECTVAEVSSINLLEGVTVTDNSGEEIIPTYQSTVTNVAGTYNIYYSATDSSGNTNTLDRARLITVR